MTEIEVANLIFIDYSQISDVLFISNSRHHAQQFTNLTSTAAQNVSMEFVDCISHR
jgi:hypothetical protein